MIWGKHCRLPHKQVLQSLESSTLGAVLQPVKNRTCLLPTQSQGPSDLISALRTCSGPGADL